MRSKELYESKVKVASKPITASGGNLLHKAMGDYFTMLDEASTAGEAVRGSPYADQLISQVHKTLAMGHDIKWAPEQKITWADIKQRAPNFVLIQGTKGTAAIRYAGESYTVMFADADGVHTENSTSINALMNVIKSAIGKPKGYWVATNTGERSRYGRTASGSIGDVERKRSAREKSREVNNPNMLEPNKHYNENFYALIGKLRPLYMKYIQHAIADIKGAAGMAIKNDAFARAAGKIEKARKLQIIYDQLEDSTNIHDMPRDIENKIRGAIYLAASHFYPDETGTVSLSSGYRGYRGNTVQNQDGPRHLINDVASGDSAKLAAIMTFFKRLLLH